MKSITRLARTLAARNARVHLRVLEGEHEGWYWRAYLPEYLRFYSSALRAALPTASGRV